MGSVVLAALNDFKLLRAVLANHSIHQPVALIDPA
jgi:hypothetical protein